MVDAQRVPSYLRDGPGHEPERWLRLVARDSEGRERFVPAGESGGIAFAPLDQPYSLFVRYVSALRVL